MTKITKTKKSNIAKDMEKLEFSYIIDISAKQCNHKKLQLCLTNVNMSLSHNPTISLLGTSIRDKKTYVHKKTQIHIHLRNLDCFVQQQRATGSYCSRKQIIEVLLQKEKYPVTGALGKSTVLIEHHCMHRWMLCIQFFT